VPLAFLEIIAALLAGNASAFFVNALIGNSIQREDAAVNEGGSSIFVRLLTKADPDMTARYYSDRGWYAITDRAVYTVSAEHLSAWYNMEATLFNRPAPHAALLARSDR